MVRLGPLEPAWVRHVEDHAAGMATTIEAAGVTQGVHRVDIDHDVEGWRVYVTAEADRDPTGALFVIVDTLAPWWAAGPVVDEMVDLTVAIGQLASTTKAAYLADHRPGNLRGWLANMKTTLAGWR